MGFTIPDYIKYAGIPVDCPELKYDEAAKIASECWETGSATVVSIEYDDFDFEIVFDHQRKKVGDKLVVYNCSRDKLLEILKFEDIFSNAFENDEEVVIFLDNNLNIHLQKDTENQGFSLARIISKSTERARGLIRTLMTEVNVEEIKNKILARNDKV